MVPHDRHWALERERAALLARYAHHRRPEDLDALVQSYLPLARSLARRFHRDAANAADIEQAACEGLVKALRRFDPSRGVPFQGFAVPTILGEVRRHLRDTSWPVHVPRSVQDRALAASRARESLTDSLGRVPTAAEVAARLGCCQDEVLEAFAARATLLVRRLEDDVETENGVMRHESWGDEDPGYACAEDRVVVAAAISQLAPAERAAVLLRFRDGKTQREIAAELGCSRSRAGRLLEGSLSHLREIVMAA